MFPTKLFQDVITKGYQLYSLGGTFTEDFFRRADPDSNAGIIYRDHLTTISSSSDYPKRLKELLFSSQKAALLESPLTYAGDKEVEAVTAFKDAFASQLAFGLQKDSEFTAAFNHHLFKMVQSGVLRQLMYKWLEGRRPEDESDRIFTEDATSLGYENLFFPMVVMLVGLAGGLALLVGERWGRRRKANTRGEDPRWVEERRGY